jgi:replicative DNA helicase
MLLSADKKHCELTNDTPIEDLETNIIPSVFDDSWNGGQYSFKNNKWLQQYCERLGIDVQKEAEEPTIEIANAFDLFKDYAKNIDSLTVKTGIDELDNRCRITIGMLVGIVAPPGVGKTSLALEVLNAMSKRDELSVFYSYDMYHGTVFQKLIQKHLKKKDEEIFDAFKNDDLEFQQSVLDTLKREYKNVEFCFKTGQTTEDIISTMKFAEEKTGKKTRLLIVDYSELVIAKASDPTQASAETIQQLRAIATLYNVAVIVLLQPSKISGSPADDLKSYRAVKGSSAIEQAVALMLGMSRPGYDPKNPEQDKFITINALKHRMGQLFSVDLHWDGFTGTIRSMTDEERLELRELKQRIAQEKEENDNDWK